MVSLTIHPSRHYLYSHAWPQKAQENSAHFNISSCGCVLCREPHAHLFSRHAVHRSLRKETRRGARHAIKAVPFLYKRYRWPHGHARLQQQARKCAPTVGWKHSLHRHISKHRSLLFLQPQITSSGSLVSPLFFGARINRATSANVYNNGNIPRPSCHVCARMYSKLTLVSKPPLSSLAGLLRCLCLPQGIRLASAMHRGFAAGTFTASHRPPWPK